MRRACPVPSGRLWQDTTIRGQKERGTGLLNNELYIGEMVWNRCSYVKDPRTGKRVARPNPGLAMGAHAGARPAHRFRRPLAGGQAAPGDRQLRHGARRGRSRPQPRHRRRYLLSGLLICGCCGGNFSVVTRDTLFVLAVGAPRAFAAMTARSPVGRSRAGSSTAIKQNLLTPELVAEFTRAYTQEFNRLVAEAGNQHAEVAGKLTAVERKIAGIMRAIEDGLYQPAMKARLTELEAEKASLMARQGPAPVVHKVSVHPNLAAVYRRKVEELESSADGHGLPRRGDRDDPLNDREHHADAAPGWPRS